MNDPRELARRRFMKRSAGIAAGALLAHAGARAATARDRTLAFVHLHTRERIELVYASAGSYVPEALTSLNRFLRDHYSGEIGVMDPRLFDLLHEVQRLVAATQPFEVISGYRCPSTNATLRATRGGGVAQNSLHMEGRAIDVRIPGVMLGELRDATLSLKAGGVGFYPTQQFVHIDTGRVRRW